MLGAIPPADHRWLPTRKLSSARNSSFDSDIHLIYRAGRAFRLRACGSPNQCTCCSRFELLGAPN